MTPIPTGRLLRTQRGRDLVLTRTFRAGIDDVWASVTEPDRTARWFGRWSGEPGVGRTVTVTMGFEDGAPTSQVRIEACEPPRLLVVTAEDEAGVWSLALELTERGDTTELQLTHHLDDRADPGSFGPGWEYYLDLLVASRDGSPRPEFADYYPAQKAHYERQAEELSSLPASAG
jgi:uncharacterized protein YndB with AHSA1/START domain